MKKLVVILVVLVCLNINAQEKKIEFTIIASSKIDGKEIDSVFKFIPNSFVSVTDKEVTLSIHMKFEDTEKSVNQKLPKVRSLSYYQIAENMIITPPEWNQSNVDAFGIRLLFPIKH